MDKMREEFELWMSTTGRVDFSKIDDIYASRDTFFMWQAWQASRKALVVELPVVESAEKRSKGIIEELRCYRDHNV